MTSVVENPRDSADAAEQSKGEVKLPPETLAASVKRCIRCGEMLTNENWPTSLREKYYHICRSCHNEIGRAHYAQNSERITSAQIARRQLRVKTISDEEALGLGKVCRRCKVPLSRENCIPNRIKRREYLCNECLHERNAANWPKYREKSLATQRLRRAQLKGKFPNVFREQKLRYEYGLTTQDYESILMSQGYRCKICENPITVPTAKVDHNHTNKKVRGLLCNRCNSGMGLFQEDTRLILRAVKYLENDGGMTI